MRKTGLRFSLTLFIVFLVLMNHPLLHGGSALDIGAVPSVSGGTAQADGRSAFAGWNITYMAPQGWKVTQTLGRTQILASQTEAGVIFLGAGMYRNAQDAIADLSLAYQMMNLQAMPMEQPQQTTIAGLQAVAATYISQDQYGRSVQGRFISVFTPHGTGLNMLAMTTPEQMPKLRATLERLAGSVQAAAPTVNGQAVAALAGSWMLYSGSYSGGSTVTGSTSNSYEETVVFDGRGNFRWQSSASVSVTTQGYTGSAGGNTSNADQGTYTVIGTSLVFKGTRGQLIVDFALQGNRLTAGGKTYVRN